jgi:hypothetical protein
MKRTETVEANALDPRMFGKDWWAHPLPVRHASINARDAGLLVQVEMRKRAAASPPDTVPCVTWRGNSTQFMATQFFSKGITAKRTSGKYYWPGQLRGTVYPDGDDCFVFVIEWCCLYSTRHSRAKRVREAMSDDSYRTFREGLMAAAPMVDDIDHYQDK